jgi:hypothetical protein
VWSQSIHADLVRPTTRWPDHTVVYTAARHTACRRIGCGWTVAGRAAAQAAGIPAACAIRGSRAASREGGFSFYLKIPENRFPLLKILENPF